jgi:hypothetical protein
MDVCDLLVSKGPFVQTNDLAIACAGLVGEDLAPYVPHMSFLPAAVAAPACYNRVVRPFRPVEDNAREDADWLCPRSLCTRGC